MAEDETPWAFTLPIEVNLRDLDALGHVNNAVYMTYLETARNRYVFSLTGKTRPQDFDFILARTVIDYRAAASFLDSLRVSLRPIRIGTSSWEFAYEIRDARDGRLLVEATSVQVSYDYAAARTMPVPQPLRRTLEAEMSRGPERSLAAGSAGGARGGAERT